MAGISLNRICKTFEGGVRAVEELSLAIGDGELVVLLGPSGCGKSTVLRMIAGLESPTSGTVVIGNRTVNDVPPKDRNIAMVFQNYALYPHMTVYGNMAFGLKLRRMPAKKIDQRIRETAELLELTGLLDRKPRALSGGQRQRVALGRSIVRKPAAFLFDEPLSNLDAKLRVQMRVEIARLHAQLGTTMVYVTHDQVEAMTLGNRLVLLKDGVAQQVDAPLTLYERPANQFVASFIGSPPMNFLRGRLATHADMLRFESDEGFSFALSAERADGLAAFADKPITVGIRPEDIGSQSAQAATDAPQLRALVELIEPMGFEQHVYLRLTNGRCVCRVDSHQRFDMGAKVAVPVFTDNAHFFDAESGATLLHA